MAKWAGIAGALAIVLLTATPAAAMSETSQRVSARDYTSFFGSADLAGAGWTTCRVTWSMDAGNLGAAGARREVTRMKQAMSAWAQASGIFITYAGREELAFDAASSQVVPADGSPIEERHIYVALLDPKSTPMMAAPVVGLGAPTRVLVASRSILSGDAMFSSAYVRAQASTNPGRILTLYLHELGHVFGLGHATLQTNVMYPTLLDHPSLGPGDTQGVRQVTQPCD